MTKETKICNICKKLIIKGEEYCTLTQFKADHSFYKDGDYHLICWKERFMDNKKLNEDSKYFMDRAFKLLNRIEEKA